MRAVGHCLFDRQVELAEIVVLLHCKDLINNYGSCSNGW